MKKKLKIIILISVLLSTVGLIYYFNLSNRHKAIVKTRALHFFNIINSNWEKTTNKDTIKLSSPSLLIDNVYKSMEGPKTIQTFSLNEDQEQLLWMTGFSIQAKDLKRDSLISNDFICHMNIDYIEQEHHGRWNMLDRINRQYPRLISLSHGIERIDFPKGYGYPFFSNEKFNMATQSLNHNIKDSTFLINHEIFIKYNHEKNIKPLQPKNIFMMLPFDINNPDKKLKDISNSCIPLETKNHTYFNDNGQAFSGHWKIDSGKQFFKCKVTDQLNIKDTVTLHQITPHLHPFAEKLVLKDITTNTDIYTCNVINHKDRIGLAQTLGFSSEKGITMYPDHEYEINLVTNNTSGKTQDMMASMFLFLYDKEMHTKITKYYNAN